MQFSWVRQLPHATAVVVMRRCRVMVFEKPEVLSRVHTRLLRVGLLTLKRRDFEVSSPYVPTRIFMSVGVLAVSRSPGIIRCGLRLDIARIDPA